MTQLDVRGSRATGIGLTRELVSGDAIVGIEDHVCTAALAACTILRSIAVDGSPGARCRVAAARVLGAVVGEATMAGQGAGCARRIVRITADDTGAGEHATVNDRPAARIAGHRGIV